MEKITRWQDMEKFAGKIIAYKSDHHKFSDKTNYKIYQTDPCINFGQVYGEPLKWASYSLDYDTVDGYELSRLIIKDAIGSVCALIDTSIQKGLFVRLATQEEIEKIIWALKSGAARYF